MKERMTLLLALAFTLSLPLAAFGMSHGKAEHDHGASADKKMEHGSPGAAHGMAGHGDMIMVGENTVEGVKGMAHLNDVGEAMKKAGMDATHHFMVVFADTHGKPITEGVVALKVTGPDGKASDPVRLVGMDGHFGGDIVLKQKGEYAFEVGTKLPDGQKRQFEFKHSLK